MRKYTKDIVLVLITLIVLSAISVSAAVHFNSENITFVPKDTNWNVSNTNSALNDLYNTSNTKITNFKTTIAQAITDMGVTTAEDADAETMANNIRNIEKSLDNSKVTNVIVTGITATPKDVNTPENCVGAVVAKGWGNGAGAYYIDASTNRIYYLTGTGGGSASTPGYTEVTSSNGNRLYFKNGVLYDAYFGSVRSNVQDSIMFFSEKSLDNSKVTNVIVTDLTSTPKDVNTPENCIGAVVAKGWGNGAGAYYIDASTNRIYLLSDSGGGSASTPGYTEVTSSYGNRLYFKNGVLFDAYFGSIISNVTDSIIFFSK